MQINGKILSVKNIFSLVHAAPFYAICIMLGWRMVYALNYQKMHTAFNAFYRYLLWVYFIYGRELTERQITKLEKANKI